MFALKQRMYDLDVVIQLLNIKNKFSQHAGEKTHTKKTEDLATLPGTKHDSK